MSCLAYNTKDAAAQLGIIVSHFKRHVKPELRAAYSGGRVLYPHTELARWLRVSTDDTSQPGL